MKNQILHKLFSIVLLVVSFIPFNSNAQGSTSVKPAGFGDRTFDIDTIYSIKNIRQDDKMYQIGVWRRIDLREKYNVSLYGSGDSKPNGIVNHIYRAVVDENALEVFADENFTKPLSISDFQSNFWLDAKRDSIFTKDLVYIDFKEDFLFDKHRSELIFDIKYLALVMPSKINANAGEKTIAYIRYKDFNSYFSDHPTARWINFNNISKSLTYDEAFESRLFRSVVRKYTNVQDAFIFDLVAEGNRNPQVQAYLDALAFEYKLLDFENSLWEW
jgi:gliding motility associated protien GldN